MATVTDEIITYTRLDVANFVSGGRKMEAAQESILAGERKLRRETAGLVRDIASIEDSTQLAATAVSHLSRIFKVGLGPGIAVGVGLALKNAIDEVAAHAQEQLKSLQQPLRIPITLGDGNKVESQINAAKQALESTNDQREAERNRPKSLIEIGINKATGADKTLDDAAAAVAAEEQGKINVLLREAARLREQDASRLRATLGMDEDQAELLRQQAAGAKMVADARWEEKAAAQEIADLQENILRHQQALKNDPATRSARLKLAEAQVPVSDTQGIDRIKLRREQIRGDLDAKDGTTFGRNPADKNGLNEGAHKKLTDAEITALKAEDAQLAVQQKNEERALAVKQRGLDLESAKLKVGDATEDQRRKIFELELACAQAEVASADTAQQRQSAENRLGEIVRQRVAYKQQEIEKEEQLAQAFQERAQQENDHLSSLKAQTAINREKNGGNRQTSEMLQIRLKAEDEIHGLNDRAKKYDEEGNKEAAKKVRAQVDEVRGQENQELDEYGLTHDPRRRRELRQRQRREARDGQHFAQNFSRAQALADQHESGFQASRASIAANGSAGTAVQHARETAANTAATARTLVELKQWFAAHAPPPPLH